MVPRKCFSWNKRLVKKFLAICSNASLMQKSDYVEKLLNQILFPQSWLPDTVTSTTDMLRRWVEMRGARGEFEMESWKVHQEFHDLSAEIIVWKHL